MIGITLTQEKVKMAMWVKNTIAHHTEVFTGINNGDFEMELCPIEWQTSQLYEQMPNRTHR